MVGFEVSFTNTSGATLTNVVLTDTRVTANLTLIEPGNALCPYANYNGNLPGPNYTAASITGSSGVTATWASVPSLASGASFTVHVCATVGAVADRRLNEASECDEAEGCGGGASDLKEEGSGFRGIGSWGRRRDQAGDEKGIGGIGGFDPISGSSLGQGRVRCAHAQLIEGAEAVEATGFSAGGAKIGVGGSDQVEAMKGESCLDEVHLLVGACSRPMSEELPER